MVRPSIRANSDRTQKVPNSSRFVRMLARGCKSGAVQYFYGIQVFKGTMFNFSNCETSLTRMAEDDGEGPILAVYYESIRMPSTITWLVVYPEPLYEGLPNKRMMMMIPPLDEFDGQDLRPDWKFYNFLTNPAVLKKAVAEKWDIVVDLLAAAKNGKCMAVYKSKDADQRTLADQLADLLNVPK